MENNLLYLMGYYLGDGSVVTLNNSKGGNRYRVSFVCKEGDSRDKIIEAFKAIDSEVSLTEYRREEKENGRFYYQMFTSSRLVSEWLIKECGQSGEKRVPSYIKDLTQEQVGWFLSGFIDADGSIKVIVYLANSNVEIINGLEEILKEFKVSYKRRVIVDNIKADRGKSVVESLELHRKTIMNIPLFPQVSYKKECYEAILKQTKYTDRVRITKEFVEENLQEFKKHFNSNQIWKLRDGHTKSIPKGIHDIIIAHL